MNGTPPTVLGPADGPIGFLGSIGVRFLVDGARSGGGFSLVEYRLSARALGAPLHRHAREDECSYVTQGRVGMLLGDDVVEMGPGDLLYKPRDEWHTFWNAGDEPARATSSGWATSPCTSHRPRGAGIPSPCCPTRSCPTSPRWGRSRPRSRARPGTTRSR